MTDILIKFDMDDEGHKRLIDSMMDMPGLADAVREDGKDVSLDSVATGTIIIDNEPFSQAVYRSWFPDHTEEQVKAVKSLGLVVEKGTQKGIEFYGG